MSRSMIIAALALAALLEAGGDAMVRHGLRPGNTAVSLLWYLLGALVLFSYAWIINATQLDFGRLLGLYVVFFFIAAQLISWLAFGQAPDRAIFVGGALIIAGGGVIFASKATAHP